jgi:hypothetical protein
MRNFAPSQTTANGRFVGSATIIQAFNFESAMEEADICKYARPGLTCGLAENTVIGCLHGVSALACLYAVYRHHVRRKSFQPIRPGSIDFTVFFWVSEALWLVYHTVIMLSYFQYSHETLDVVICIDQLLFLLPIGFVILVVSERASQSLQPRRDSRLFSRFLFVVTMLMILFLGICASFVHVDEPGESGDVMFLWQGCMSLVIATFVIVPSQKVIHEVTEPVTSIEDAPCVRRSRILLWAFGINFAIIALYGILAFLGWNPLQTALHNRVVREDKLQSDTRLAYAVGGLLFQDLPSAWAVLAVFWLGQRDEEYAVSTNDAPESIDISVK